MPLSKLLAVLLQNTMEMIITLTQTYQITPGGIPLYALVSQTQCPQLVADQNCLQSP